MQSAALLAQRSTTMTIMQVFALVVLQRMDAFELLMYAVLVCAKEA